MGVFSQIFETVLHHQLFSILCRTVSRGPALPVSPQCTDTQKGPALTFLGKETLFKEKNTKTNKSSKWDCPAIHSAVLVLQ